MKQLIFAFLITLLFVSDAFAERARVYVLTGQGGRATSGGIVQLANKLAEDKRLLVSIHVWKNYNDVVRSIWTLPPGTPIIVIGYSLGANATTWISNATPLRQIDLVVAYDPSVLTVVSPAGPNVSRLLLYHNTSVGPYGHARIPGLQVETTETRMAHLRVDWSMALHRKTHAAIERVLGKYR